MSILVTGASGFIGSALVMRLLNLGEKVIGIDNHNNYYDPKLKEARLARYIKNKNYSHLQIDLADKVKISSAFTTFKPHKVINLAAQAGVRYSLENPLAYIESNVVGFANILEGCRNHGIEHLVYASSSSVYGANTDMPYSVSQSVNHPLNLYSASKISNELMAHAYSHLYELPTTGLRFFTVYGPWGRPDMALFKFTKSILAGEKITLFNHGNHRRDFTYIDDIVEGIVRVLACPSTPNTYWNGKQPDPSTSKAPWRIYNIGNNKSIKLIDFVSTLEDALNKRAEIVYLPLQAGDVTDTLASIYELETQFDFKPAVSIDLGIRRFVEWYRDYYKQKK